MSADTKVAFRSINLFPRFEGSPAIHCIANAYIQLTVLFPGEFSFNLTIIKYYGLTYLYIIKNLG